MTLYLRGLEGVLVQAEQPLASIVNTPVPTSGHLLFRAGPGLLTYLGRPPERLDAPVSATQLLGTANAPGSDVLSVVSGWLVVGGIHSCPVRARGRHAVPRTAALADGRPAIR